MKTYLITGILALLTSVSINAQDISKNALGLRLGDSDGFGAEVSYQRALNDNKRLEFDLGWRDSKYYDGFKLAALHQWVWNIEDGFNWYAGVGGGLGSYSFNNNNGNDYTDTFAFVAGDIGIEYNFNIPLLLSLDFRPEIGFGDETYDNNDLDFDIALGIRYQF
ncbi:hypothetical protein QLS71_003960 [Mariniflexile litorale]|uniref:Outer membrane protein beta-barrel domain-containing protein n=1 Tax=Mariniflexile litorale TaxID=3045158 RepID=A0AAU7EI96_9FLAO|nr:hypothetical protein [Mariniflexile sp. KMM 9835]MDQ8210175.1 hypothetical protein [Mariniflexile sp. KMM 9835]